MKMKFYSLLLAIMFIMPFFSYSQSITDYQTCLDYFGGISNDNHPVNVEFMNRVFGTNYTSIPGSCNSFNCNPGLITDDFLGCRKTTCGDAICSNSNTHKGLDIRSAANTNVYAPLSGIVRNVDASCGGRLVIEDDSDPNLKFYFLHMNTIYVTDGTHVNMGDIVGQSGVKYAYTNSSGQIVCSTIAEHLHAEIRHYSSSAPKAQSTCVTCTDNYDPRLIVLLHPRARDVNDRLDIYAGSASNKKQIKIWFRLPGISNGTFSVQNCFVGSYDVSQNIVNRTGCNGIGQFTIDFPNVVTNGLANTTYDIRFDINGSANRFQGFDQVYLLDPSDFTDIPSQDIWHFPYVRFGIEEGFFKGISLGSNQYKFDGAGLVTRGQAAKVVFMAANKLHLMEIDITGPVLQNLSPTHWAFPFMQSLYKDSVISDGRPDDLITTGQFAKMLVNALSLNTNDENDNTLKNGSGRTQSNASINSSDPTLQQYLEIVNKIMLYTTISNNRGYLEPVVNGLLCVSNAQLNGSLVTAVGSNTLSRDLMAKTIVNIYKYKKDKIGNYQPCFGGPQFLNIFNNNFGKFTVIGDKFELTSTPTGTINTSTSSASINMESGEIKDFGLDNNVLDGYNLHFYWCVDSGQLVSLFPNNNHKKVRFTAPNVTAPTPVTLYLYIGCGNGMTKEAIYNITVYPQGQSPNTVSPNVQASNLQFTGATTSSISLSWARGSGQKCIVTCTPLGINAIDAPDPGVVYTSNSNYNSAPFIFNGSDTKVVYTGTGNSLTVSGLSTNTSYRFAVYEFNGSTAQTVQYNVTNPAYGVGATLQNPPPPTPPSAHFSWSTPVVTGQAVTFQNLSSGATSYSWTFQSGTPSSSSATNPADTFASAGTYNVTLTAFNSSSGLSDVFTSQVQVYTPASLKADLLITDAQMQPTTIVINGSSTITYTVANQGYSYTSGQAINTMFYLSSDNTWDLSDYYFNTSDFVHTNNIAPGSSETGSKTLTITNAIASPGQYYLIVMADGAGAVNESNETNNYYAIPITLVSGLPNLTYSNTSVTPSTINSGGMVTVNWNLKNTALTDLDLTTIYFDYYISQDNLFSSDDLYLTLSNTYDNILAGQTKPQTSSFKIPGYVNSGAYYLIGVIDRNNLIPETNESDNVFTIPLTVANPGQPTIQASNISISNITNTSCRLSWTNGNGNGRVVVASTSIPNYSTSNSDNGTPRDSISYSANSNFPLAQSINTGNPPYKVVFDGGSNFVDITGLTTNTDYHFTVFEYNNVTGGKNYLLSHNTTGATGNGYYKGALAKIAATAPLNQGFYKMTGQELSGWNNDKGACFINDSSGNTVFGEYYHRTIDGGKSWSYSELSLDDVGSCYAIGNMIWVGGSGGYMAKSTDGGLTFTKLNSNYGFRIRAIQFIDANNGYYVGGDVDGACYKTTNGGTTWTKILSTPKYLCSVDVQSNTIVVSGISGVIMKSLDGGTTWSSHSLPNYGVIHAHNFLSKSIIKAVCETQNNFYISNNGGNSWQTTTVPGVWLTKSFFLNDSVGWVGGNNSIAKTINGGSSFSSYSSAFTNLGVTDLFATSPKTAYIFTGNGVYKTISGGDSLFVFKPTYTNSVCTNSSLRIYFKTNQAFSLGNIFRAELSDTSGSFASPYIIGQKQSLSSDSVDWLIPANITPSNKYRIRIVASNPHYESEAGEQIQILAQPTALIVGLADTFWLTSGNVNLTPLGISPGGIFTVNGNTTTTFSPSSLGLGVHTVRYTNQNGICSNYQQKTVIVIPTPLITITAPTPATVCPGSNISFNYTSISIYPGNTFTVELSDKNGSFLSPTIIYSLAGNSTSGAITATIPVIAPKGTGYKIRLKSNSPVSQSGNSIAFTIDTLLTPAVSIQTNSATICQGQSATFTSTVQNGGPSPFYQWKLNGLATGTNAPTYTNAQLNNQDEISLTLTSNAQCALPTTVSASPAIVTVNPLLTPGVYIIADDTAFCSGANASFAAYSSNEGVNPVYQWQINGIVAGTNSSFFSPNSLVSNDKVSVNLTSSEQCLVASTAYDSLLVHILPVVTPTISISATNVNYCTDQLFSWAATTTNSGPTPVYEWYINNIPQGVNNSTYSTPQALPVFGGAAVSCVLTSSANCASPQTVTSNVITTPPVVFSPSPAGNITGDSIICGGGIIKTYRVPASANGQIINWSITGGGIITNGQGTNQITVNWTTQAGTYDMSVYTSNACGQGQTTSEPVTIYNNSAPDITIALNNATVCDNAAATITATVVNAGATPTYQWKLNGQIVGGDSSTYLLANPVTGNSIVCVLTSSNICSTINTDTSNTINITTTPAPSTIITLNPPVWCGNNPTNMEAPACPGCSYYWRSGGYIPFIGNILIPINGNTNSVAISNSYFIANQCCGVYVTVTDPNGCSATNATPFTATHLSGSFDTITSSTCQSTPYNFHGILLSNSGSFNDTLNSANGCDSIVTLNLTVMPNIYTNINASICNGTGYLFKGQNLSISGIYNDTLTAVSGCDSIVILTLTVNNPTSSAISQHICQGDSYIFNGQSLTTYGTYTDTLLNYVGCDSVITLQLFVDIPPAKPLITIIGDTAFCFGDSTVLQTSNTNGTLLWNTAETTLAITVTVPNVYNVQVTNQCGTAVSDNQQIAVYSLPTQPSVIQTGDTLASTVIANSYQWYYNQSILNGATSQSIEAAQNGNYQVEVTDANGCKNRSALYNFTTVGVDEIFAPFTTEIIPNPNTGQFTVQFSDNTPHQVSVTDVVGRVLLTETIIGTKQITNEIWCNGVYFLNINACLKTSSIKFVIAK